MNVSNSWPEDALAILRNAKQPFILTGAGMSAESGIPTFRDALTGYWSKYSPEDLATPQAFDANPNEVWGWYEERRAGIRQTAPHAGHEALASLEKQWPGLVVVTQNVDGFHELAGSSDVIELHGNIMRSVCSETGREIPQGYIEKTGGHPPPSPHHPKGLARPGVVWFGEALAEDALARAWRLATESDVLLSIGTSNLVHPAASLPSAAKQAGATIIEINLEPTPLSEMADYCIRSKAGEVLTALLGSLSKPS